MYLTGALELRNGPRSDSTWQAEDLVRALAPSMFFDYMGVRLDSDKAVGHDMVLNWVFSDLGQPFALTLRNGVLTYREGMRHEKPDATVTMTKSTLDRISLRQITLPEAMRNGEIRIEGDGHKLAELMGLMTTFDPSFNIVMPLAKH